jgi:hypothetical protein
MMSRPSPGPVRFDDIVSEFGVEVTRKLQEQAGYPEAQLRDPFAHLLRTAGHRLGLLDVFTVDETPLDSLNVRPDFMVKAAGASIGYAELKAHGHKIPTVWTSPTGRELRQWGQLKLLPNVLYSDGEHWGVFHFGELSGAVARLEPRLRTAGARLRPTDGAFERVITEFLHWEPVAPRSLSDLVKAAAHLCHLLRDEVAVTIERETHGQERDKIFSHLARDWRAYLLPELSDNDFADAYAQTVTFALLLARVFGIEFGGRNLAEIARLLGKRQSFMGKALAVLTEHDVERRSVAIMTMLRVIGAVDWDKFGRKEKAAHQLLYQRFLADYDPRLQRETGAYYTPDEVVAFMVRFSNEILERRMNIRLGLANEKVRIIDPAMGTGTFLLSIIDHVIATTKQENGPQDNLEHQLLALFGRLMGFEQQAGPYAVAELRIHQTLKEHQTEVPEREVQVYLANTLDDPDLGENHIPATLQSLAEARQKANEIKRNVPIDLAIGNPPYREQASGLGGWVEKRDKTTGAPLDAFRAPGRGRFERVLSNLYVYFWRWATHKVFDADPDHPAGIVAFVSPSSFTTGRGYAGMREYLRHTADEGWIIDIFPESFRADVGARVFPEVQHKLCVAVFARYGVPDRHTAAAAHYIAVRGSRAEKFRRLETLGIDDDRYEECDDDWQALFVPASSEVWRSFPALGDLFPWVQPGVKPNRNWVLAPDTHTLYERWKRLILADGEEQKQFMKVTRDRSTTLRPGRLPGAPRPSVSIRDETGLAPTIRHVALRSFDSQQIIYDPRVIDFARAALWQARGEKQVYTSEQHVHPIETGPGLTFSAYVPDMHYFNARGGRVHPLYRDADGLIPNVAPGFLRVLSDRLSVGVGAEDLLAYITGAVAHPGYTERFAAELRTPGIRVPLTADAQLWTETARMGRRVLWLHTYGERFADPYDERPSGPPRLPDERRPLVRTPIPGKPTEITYNPAAETLFIGTGAIRPVPEGVWHYDVGGMRIVRRWFDYRKNPPRRRITSPLDRINAPTWNATFTTDLLNLLNVLALCTELEPQQATLLEAICDGPLITVEDMRHAGVFPVPGYLRKPPRVHDPDAARLF